VTRHPDGPGDSPGFLLWRATLDWQRQITSALQPLDLTHVQFVLLACAWWLETRGDSPNQQALAQQAGTDIKMTSQVLRRLEAKGVLQRRVDPQDSRAKKIWLTPAGTDLAQRAIHAVEAVDAQVFGDAAPDLTAVLQRLTAQQPRNPQPSS
jgi:DNA-binding MarR family transcriptional regulator